MVPISREESAVLSAGVGAFVEIDDIIVVQHDDFDGFAKKPTTDAGTLIPRLGRDTKFEEEKQRGGIVDEKLERHDGRVRETRLGDVQRRTENKAKRETNDGRVGRKESARIESETETMDTRSIRRRRRRKRKRRGRKRRRRRRGASAKEYCYYYYDDYDYDYD